MSRDLEHRGYSIRQGFLSDALITRVQGFMKRGFVGGRFRRSGVGVAHNYRVDENIRGDQIWWLNRDMSSDVIDELFDKFERLKKDLNQSLFLGLNDFECHFAVYPPGAGYKRHKDQLKNHEDRKITITLYLNSNWSNDDGGQLRLYVEAGQDPIDILPTAGTLVAFLSDDLEHEVLESHRTRLSLTGWFRAAPTG